MTSPDPNTAPVSPTLALDPVAEPGKVYRRLLKYTKQHRAIFALGIFGVLLDASAQPAFVKLTQYLVDGVLTNKDAELGLIIAGVIFAIGILRVIGNFVGVWSMEWVGRRVVADLRRELFASYLALPARFFDRHSAGNLISRLTYNSEQVATASSHAILSVVRDSIMVTGQLTVMVITSIKLSISIFILGPIIALIVSAVSRRFRKISSRIQESMGAISNVTEEAVNANRVIKVFAGHQQEQKRFDTVNELTRRLSMRMVATRLASSSLIQVAATVVMAVIIIIAIQPGILSETTPGEFNVVFFALIASIPPLKRLTAVQEQFAKGVAAAQSLFKVIDLPPEADTGVAPITDLRGEIEFRNLSFAYEDSEDLILDDISFHIPAGSVTALVGHSGSGKTTLASLIPRFFDYTNGSILLDGRELSEYRLTELRAHISLVSQEVVLFNDTVTNNIAYGALANADEAAIVEAARAAHALAFIERLPQGMQTEVGKNGVGLSGGQRQRLAIARALLKNAPLLILDEATSALDSESEKAIQIALEKVMQGRTTLVIAHRLSTIENADQVVVLDSGKVVEKGTHDELLAAGGVYAALYRTQFSNSYS
jgi:subfamily B ATP-binding cassette protein MsbA